jgi:hypothetical protein
MNADIDAIKKTANLKIGSQLRLVRTPEPMK